MWRIASSPRFGASLSELETQWTLLDFLDAHQTLDLMEELEAKRYTPPKSK